MQKDSTHFSTSDHMTHNQALPQESQIRSFQCSHCTLIFKSKVCLFEHINEVHGLHDTDAGSEYPGTNKANADNNSTDSGDAFKCQHCDFKACSRDILDEHEERCQKKSKSHNGTIISENPETKSTVISTNQHKKAAGAKEISSYFPVLSTSQTKYTLNSSKDLKTYKRPLQTITKYFSASSESNGKSSVKIPDCSLFLESTKETLILQESPSSPNSSGVFKVTAKPMIDILQNGHDCFLLDNYKGQFKETVPNNVDSSKGPPAKKAKTGKEKEVLKKANASNEQKSSNTEFSFDFSDVEEENNLVNENTDTPSVYSCKHCDFSDVDVTRVSTHYQNEHPYVRYKAVYIQDPSDQSATFRCLQCPVEFLSVATLKRHHKENHPEAPDVFTMKSHELCLVFKCFVCPFTTDASKDLKEHYKEDHPSHQMHNSLMYCRYSAARCQEESSQLNSCEKAPSPERPRELSPERAHTPCKEDRIEPSPQHPTSNGPDVALYHCSNCEFSHKSVIVMHVHYQKSHPDEVVTIDKIKQSTFVKSQTTPDKSPNSMAPQKNTPASSNKTGTKAELSLQKISLSLRNLKNTPKASKAHSESPKTKKVESAKDRRKGEKTPTQQNQEKSDGTSTNKLFYCRFCSYSSVNLRSVLGHHNAAHTSLGVTDMKDIILFSAQVRKKKLATPSDSKTRKVEVRSEKELEREDDKAERASVTEFNAYECAENLFYCQKCNYGNPSIKGVVNHQSSCHQSINSNKECVVEYTALIRDEIEKSKSQPKESSRSSLLPLPLINEGDEDAFFCHFCNYRHKILDKVVRHYMRKHRGFSFGREEVRRYSSMILKEIKKLHPKTTANKEVKDVSHASIENKGNEKKKTRKLGKEVSVSPSMTSQTQRILQCHRCSYSTENLYLLRKHILNAHKAKYSVRDVLRMCFKQGNLQTGHHCEFCTFSHETVEAVYEHYMEQHPRYRASPEYITSCLYVGPKTSPHRKKKPQIQHTDSVQDSDVTDGSSSSQRCGQTETKTYSCRACSFKASSMSSMAHHYRAVHPWSVKEDGSVLDVIKKTSGNRQVEDRNDVPFSFDSYQVPLEFDNSPGSSLEATEPSTMFKCHDCPASFQTQRGLNTHCGLKHQNAATENEDEQQEEQVQIQTRVHVFKCPYCTYVNNSYQGVGTHCQMRHPALASRVESLHVDEAHLHNCLKREGPDLRLSGYICKACPQIYATLEKLNKHLKQDHNKTVANPVSEMLKPPTVSKKKQYNIHSNQGSVSKSSFLSKKIYAMIKCQHCAYSCTTKIALGRHLRLHHSNAVPLQFVAKAQDCTYKCVLCSKVYFMKKRLGNHYFKKHGKESFLKYYVPLYQKVHKKAMPASSDHPLIQEQENTSEACGSSMMTEDNKKIVYKCPSCAYVNASFHGTLTHCQMRHPALIARADKLQTEEIPATNMFGCTLGKNSKESGFMCKKCLQIYASEKKLKIHCERDHSDSTEIETEKQHDHDSQYSVLEAFSLKNKTSPVSTTETGSGHQLGNPEACHSNTLSVQNTEPQLYKCSICAYAGWRRRYLHHHYKHTHKLDAFTRIKLLEVYNKRKKTTNLPESEESTPVRCKMCPNSIFDSSQLLIDHYSTFHSSDCVLNFTVLSRGSKRTTGLYKCVLCGKQLNGIRKLCYHLERHTEAEKKKANDAKTKASDVMKTAPEARSFELRRQDELPTFETVADLAQWNLTPAQTFTLSPSPLSSPPKVIHFMQPQTESREDKHACKQCGRTFMSLKGLRSHERSHAAVAAIEKLNTLPTSSLKHKINKYVIHKAGTTKPFLCSFCSYRTNVMGLWRRHFMKNHKDVLEDPAETDNENEQSVSRTDRESSNSSEESDEHEIGEESLYSEPPEVQRQLDQYSLMAQAGAPSETNTQEIKLTDNCLRCEFCNFNTGHLRSIRRHYLNRHGKKIFRCKDCSFFTGLRKTLEVHIETGHSTCQSEPTHQKDLRCPFCLYQTKNKNNMIDHIVLHREERVVPIEVRRPKLSHYLRGIVFRCHKCTFTSGSAENLRVHMTKHDDVKPYKCRLCYFDCTQLSDLEAHLSDKHQVMRNHELVGHVSLDQLEARVGRIPEDEEEPLPNLKQHNNDSEEDKTEEFVTDCDEAPLETQAKTPEEITALMKDARGQGTENVSEWSDADMDYGDHSGPEKEKARDQVNQEAVSASNHRQENNIRAQEKFTPNCAQLKRSHKESLGEEQVHHRKNSEELRDRYEEMPVLENEYHKGEMPPLDCCNEDEMISEDDENRCTNQEIKDADNPRVSEDSLTDTNGAPEDLRPPTTEKPFTCEFCGRNLTSSSDLERHIMRHGI